MAGGLQVGGDSPADRHNLSNPSRTQPRTISSSTPIGGSDKEGILNLNDRSNASNRTLKRATVTSSYIQIYPRIETRMVMLHKVPAKRCQIEQMGGREMSQRIKVMVAGAAIATLGATFFTVSPAYAASCPSGHYCIYTGLNFGGTMAEYGASTNQLSEPVNDDTFSAINNTSQGLRIYRGSNYGGSHTCIQPHQSIGDLTFYSVGRWGSSAWLGSNCG
jgi:hypothetical protein